MMYSRTWEFALHKGCSWLVCCAHYQQRPLTYTRHIWSLVLGKTKACFSPDHIPIRVWCLLCIASWQDCNWSFSSCLYKFFLLRENSLRWLLISMVTFPYTAYEGLFHNVFISILLILLLSFRLSKAFTSQLPTITFLDLLALSSLPLPAPTVESCFVQGVKGWTLASDCLSPNPYSCIS